MDADEEVLTGKVQKRRMVAAAIAVPFIAIMALGVWYFLSAQRSARERMLVEQVTGAAFGCVASMRGDAPEPWGLERALEHMSRMERETRGDDADPSERERFQRLSIDAARGCEALGRLMLEARRDSPHLYFAVPAKLAQPPLANEPERWMRRVLPKSRGEVDELSRQIRAMQEAINARRAEHALMPTALPIDGQGAAALARKIDLGPLPSELERPVTEAWPLPEHVLVLRRGSIGRVLCDTRYLNRTSCYQDFVQTVGWDGAVSELLPLERPSRVSYWAAFTATQDGALWAVGADGRGRGVLGRYRRGERTPELMSLPAAIDAAARMVEVIGGVAVVTSDERTWVASPGGSVEPTMGLPPPLVLEPEGGPESGIRADGVGALRVFGNQEEGFTSRFSTPTGDLLTQVIDARSRVRRMVSLRGLRSGQVVLVLEHELDGPRVLLLSRDFGRSWLSDTTNGDR